MDNSNVTKPAGEGLSPAIELMRRATEEAVNEAMEDQFLSFLEDCLSDAETPRNGHYERKVLTTVGEITVRVPRDRLGLFRERVIGRYRRRIDGLDWEIGRLYSQGMSASDISQYLSAKSGVEVSEKLVLAIVKGSYGEAEKFNSRALPRCPFVYLDGTWLPVRRRYEGGDRYEKECVMVALGVTESGRKEVLGFWMVPEESSAAWEKCLRSLRERGVGDPLLFVTDGLQGMPEAIRRAFPDSPHQRCLVHVGRNMSSGARKKDRQGILDDFKEVYSAESEAEAKARLGLFVAKWAKTYPSFRRYLSEPGLFSFYRFPRPIRKALYTSNAVEAFHACLKRKLRSRLGIHSIRNGYYLISVEAERYNRSRHCKAIAGFDELSDEELKQVGMSR